MNKMSAEVHPCGQRGQEPRHPALHSFFKYCPVAVALDNEQRIEQIAADDFPTSGLQGEPNTTIHHEPGPMALHDQLSRAARQYFAVGHDTARGFPACPWRRLFVGDAAEDSGA